MASLHNGTNSTGDTLNAATTACVVLHFFDSSYPVLRHLFKCAGDYSFPSSVNPFYLGAWPHTVSWTADQQVDLKPWKARAPPVSALVFRRSRTESLKGVSHFSSLSKAE